MWSGLLGLELHKGNDVPDTQLEVDLVCTYILQLCLREAVVGVSDKGQADGGEQLAKELEANVFANKFILLFCCFFFF